MDEDGFRSFLREGRRVPKNLGKNVIRQHIKLANQFEAFIRESSPRRTYENATAKDVRRFIKRLAKSHDHTWDNLIGLLRYSRFAGNREVELELLLMLDGADVLEKLLGAAREKVGRQRYDEMFDGFVPPPLGTPKKDMPEITQDFMTRLGKGTDTKTCRDILLTGVHAGPSEAYADEIEMLRDSEDVDEYLAKRREKMIELLEGHFRNGTLFYTQEIDELSLEFVKNNPEVAGGIRKGDNIFQTKIPYMMKECLRQKDPIKRRYYYCHCPLARESILTGMKMHRDFCYCSAGYEKKPYEVAFGVPVKATVLKSVLRGDDVCRFKMEIPKKYRARRRRKKGAKKARPTKA